MCLRIKLLGLNFWRLLEDSSGFYWFYCNVVIKVVKPTRRIQMRISKKNKQRLHGVILDQINDVRGKLHNGSGDDFLLAQVVDKIWDKLVKILEGGNNGDDIEKARF